jgi:hypothetical protein
MRSKLVPAVLALSLAMGGAAFASTTTQGTVKAIDMTAHTLTLDNGTVYQLPAGFSNPSLKVGEKVSVVWDMKGSTHEATAVTIVK